MAKWIVLVVVVILGHFLKHFWPFLIHICILLKNDEKREDNQSINQSINQWNFIKLSDDPRIG